MPRTAAGYESDLPWGVLDRQRRVTKYPETRSGWNGGQSGDNQGRESVVEDRFSAGFGGRSSVQIACDAEADIIAAAVGFGAVARRGTAFL